MNRDGSYSDINGSRWTTYYFRDDDGNYYEVEAESDGSLGNRQYSIGYYTGSGFYRDWNQLGTTSRNQNANLWTGTLYTRQEITTSKMEAMQSAVNGFIDQVAENAAGADNDVTHRISIVKFADDSYADSVGNDRQDDYYAYNYTQIVKDFTTVDAAGVQQLTGAIEALKPARRHQRRLRPDPCAGRPGRTVETRRRRVVGRGSDADRRPAGRQAGRGGLYRW